MAGPWRPAREQGRRIAPHDWPDNCTARVRVRDLRACRERLRGVMQYWLIKTEPDVFGWAQQVEHGVEPWTGVRSHQAKNNLKAMKRRDRCFFYHSNIGKEIVGIVEVVREAYPDPSVDESAQRSDWVCVDMKAVAVLKRPVTLAEAKADPALADMSLVRFSRLSVAPITAPEWKHVLDLAGGTKKL